MKQVLQYYKQGFFLLRQSLLLLGISFILSIIMYFLNLLRGPQELGVFFFSLILALFSFGYQFSLPKFLLANQKQGLNLLFLRSEIWSSVKRLIIPLIVIILLLLVLSIAIGFVLVTYFGSSVVVMKVSSAIVIAIINTALVFVPIYFSLEDRGIVDSINASFRLFTTKTYFLVPVLVLQLLQSLTVFLPTDNPLGWFLLSFEGSFLQLWLLASALLFYQSLKKSSKKKA